jgi:Flp pilus assembly protein TadG
MTTTSVSTIWLRTRRSVTALLRDTRGIAATEFAMVLPIMLVTLFGTVEISNGVAVDRKVTLVAQTLSDLTSQSTTVANTDLQNFFAASGGILTPYDVTPTQATLSEIYVDAQKNAKIRWSKAATLTQVSGVPVATLKNSVHNVGDTMPVPTALLVPSTYLIYSEVSYLYTPAVGYVMGKAGVTLSDTSYTRPRQSSCVMYGTTVC